MHIAANPDNHGVKTLGSPSPASALARGVRTNDGRIPVDCPKRLLNTRAARARLSVQNIRAETFSPVSKSVIIVSMAGKDAGSIRKQAA
jgi:hypothetical protein